MLIGVLAVMASSPHWFAGTHSSQGGHVFSQTPPAQQRDKSSFPHGSSGNSSPSKPSRLLQKAEGEIQLDLPPKGSVSQLKYLLQHTGGCRLSLKHEATLLAFAWTNTNTQHLPWGSGKLTSVCKPLRCLGKGAVGNDTQAL